MLTSKIKTFCRRQKADLSKAFYSDTMKNKQHSVTKTQMLISPPHRSWVNAVIDRQAVLLAPDHRASKPSQNFRSSGISWICSLLQWRDRAGITPDFPIKPIKAPISKYVIIQVIHYDNSFKECFHKLRKWYHPFYPLSITYMQKYLYEEEMTRKARMFILNYICIVSRRHHAYCSH